MATGENSPPRRTRGSIRRVGSALQVRVSAGKDPDTGERIVLSETIRIDKPGNDKSEREAAKEAEAQLRRLLVDADEVRASRSKATIGSLFDTWMAQHDVDPTTLDSYESLIRLYLRPGLGKVTLTLFMRNPVERMERFYADLRRCRKRCDRRPFIEHKADGEHNCTQLKCAKHRCAPLAPASVRRIHFVLSGALTAAKRWGWISYNPADMTKKPVAPKPQPHPPSAAHMAAIIETAWRRDNEFGLFLWLSAILGSRRGEGLAIRFDNCDLDNDAIFLYENWVWTRGGLLLKDTKDHQMRRISIDKVTTDLIRRHKLDCTNKLLKLGLPLTGSEFLFSRAPDRSRPRDPSSMTRRYGRLVGSLGIKTELRQLRHYSATELLTAGVDLRTVAGRLGHRDGITTMRHYAAWVGSADKQAANKIAERMPTLPDQATG